MTAAPPDLRAWQRVESPKYKKDYPGKMLRVHNPTRENYERVDGTMQRVRKPDALLPPGAVLHLRQRYTNGIDSEGKSRAILVCDWICPCCGHKHERQINESRLAEAEVEFVEGSGLNSAIRPVVYLASPYSHPDPAVRQDRWLQACAAAVWLTGKGSDSFDGGYVIYAPICMGHPISVVGAQSGLGHDAVAWERHTYGDSAPGRSSGLGGRGGGDHLCPQEGAAAVPARPGGGRIPSTPARKLRSQRAMP